MAGQPTLSLKQMPADTVLLILYHYLPNKQAAIAAVILYAVITVGVTAVTVKTRSWYMLTVALTGVMELTGKRRRQQQQQQSGAPVSVVSMCAAADLHIAPLI
jgi:hypothetical protein